MSTTVPDLPLQQPTNFMDDFLGMFSFFIDPASAARRVHHKWFWVGPLIVISILSIIGGIMLQPILQHVVEVAPVPDGVPPDQYQKTVGITLTIQRIGVFLSPVIVAIFVALQALVIFAACAVAGIKAPFRALFNLVMGCGLIASLGQIATVIILKVKGQVETRAELQPPLGLDIFLGEGTNKFLLAFLNYFSIFQIWWIVMAVLILSAAFGVSKGKALAVLTPLILISLVIKVVAAAFVK